MDHQSKSKKMSKSVRCGEKNLPLAQVQDTDWVQVLSVQCDHERRSELEQLGVIPGSKLRVLHNDHKGTLIVKVEQEMVILGRNYSYRTFVQPLQK